ncbi:MAG: hypothetical protein ACRC5T_13480 [Cetobacterium sp.]
MALSRRRTSIKKKDGEQVFDGILTRLSELKEINGSTRTITIELENIINPRSDVSTQVYGKMLDTYSRYRDYKFSQGTADHGQSRIDSNPTIQKSLKSIGSGVRKRGQRRPESELDLISKEMAKDVVEDILQFIASGGNNVPQPWKKDGGQNLLETGSLMDSVYAKITSKTKRGKGKTVTTR